MDPHATWEELKLAVDHEDWATIYESASALAGWLDRDGFPPNVLGFEDTETALKRETNRVLARTACQVLIARAVERGWPS